MCAASRQRQAAAATILLLPLLACGQVNTAVELGNESSLTWAGQEESALEPWRHRRLALACAAGQACVVPAGQTWKLDASVAVSTLTIRGRLEWDTTQDGLELRAGYVLVESGGSLQIGTQASPMRLRATIYITKGQEHPVLGKRFLGSVGNAETRIYGRPLTRTWTLLAQTATRGATRLQVKDDPASMQWRVGDRIGIATTSRGKSALNRITRIEANVLHLESPLENEHWGGFRTIGGRSFEMAAEVVNLERTVLITGDHDDFASTKMGLHTKMVGEGLMDIRYTRVEWCGQRDIKGRYCMHLHYSKHCPDCVLQGNAVVDSQQVGITLHGTHDSLVDQNIIWDTVGAGIYIEDGNEMDNTISRNVIICSSHEKCNGPFLDNRDIEVAGIYMIGMSNNVIENRVIAWENGIWTFGSKHYHGQGAARGKACPMYTPFGCFRGNVFHDNERFGLYLDNQQPRNLRRDADGMLLPGETCDAFTDDGQDNGVVPANVIEDTFDWHNLFVGQYKLGDIAFVRHTSVNNLHNMYWKASKNFADQQSYHMQDCIYANDPTDSYGHLAVLGPSGPFTFKMKNVVFLGGPVSGAALHAGQHCGLNGAGGPCNVQYSLEGVDFSQLDAGAQRINFGVNTDPHFGWAPVFLAEDNSLGGYRSIVSGHLNGFANEPGCEAAGRVWAGGVGCSREVRRLNVWTKSDIGMITISGPGYRVAPNLAEPVRGTNGGRVHLEPMHFGYGVTVFAGERYQLSGAWDGTQVVEFSDAVLQPADAVSLQIGGRTCEVKASDCRNFIGPYGIKNVAQTPPRTACLQAAFGGGGSSVCASSGAPAGRSFCGAGGASDTRRRRTPVTTRRPQPPPPSSPPGGAGAGAGAGWLRRPGLNCYEGRGARDVAGMSPVEGQLSLAACQAKCEAHASCDAIVMPSGQNPGTCFLRTDTALSDCASGSGYDTWALSRTGGSNPTVTTAAPTAATWLRRPERNCYEGRGARDIAGMSPVEGQLSLAACQAKCKAHASCDAIVMPSGQNLGTCFLRADTTLSDCASGPGYDTWELRAATTSGQTSGGNPAAVTTPAPAPATTNPAGHVAWRRHPELNCFDGHGARGIAGMDPAPTPLSLAACRARCKADASCNAIVMPSGQDHGPCWLRTDTRVSDCVRGPGYDTWELQGQSTAAPALTWRQHPARNCYDGHGARGIAGMDPAPTPLSLADCQAACVGQASCDAIVMPSGQNVGHCWLRTSTKVSDCVDGPGYDVWQLQGDRTGPGGRLRKRTSTTTLAPSGGDDDDVVFVSAGHRLNGQALWAPCVAALLVALRMSSSVW